MPFLSNKAIHPGALLADAIEHAGMSQKSLSERTGFSEKHISQIINGEASITTDTALAFENALGGHASFWTNLERDYQETKARIARAELARLETSQVSRFPYTELVSRNYFHRTPRSVDRVEQLWRFFGVNSLDAVSVTEAVSYRKTPGVRVKEGSIAAWLRCGELEHRERTFPEYSASTLKNTLPKLRYMTLSEPDTYTGAVQKVLGETGVSLVYTPHFKGAGVSASARWMAGTPLIQISTRGQYEDIFWFNLFHEIAHILEHGKKDRFIEFEDKALLPEKTKEKEADNFAENYLIARKTFLGFVASEDFSRVAIKAFAAQEKIHPGIVEGRLAHQKYIPWAKPAFRKKFVYVPTNV